ncbi:DUF4244 domain-containing protein [Actinophytocola sp. KF-1]
MFLRPRHVFLEDDTGMATVEYTVGVLVGATLALILWAVVKSGSVEDGITDLIDRALTVKG